MSYLLIENKVKAIPSIEAIRMLGVSFSRGNDSSIGQFGSGFPASLALLARCKDNQENTLLNSLKLCLGKNVYTFDLVDHVMRNSHGGREFRSEIRMRKQNGGSWDLNISTEFGAMDWTDETMAVREFVSNALDGAEQYDGTYNTVRIESGPEGDSRLFRAKDGYVRLYMMTNYRIHEYVKDINKYFICMNSDYDKNRTVFENEDGGPARVYRKGVLVGEFGEKSLFHYNIKSLDLKESRIVDSSEATHKCARAISVSGPEILTKFIKASNGAKSSEYWESQFSTYSVDVTNRWDIDSGKKEVAKANWRKAIDEVMDGTVLCESATTKAMIEGKGLTPFIPTSAAFGTLMKELGAKSSDQVLNKNEIEGRITCDATPNVIACLDRVWSELEAIGVTGGKDRPNVTCFHQNGVNGMAGYYESGGDTIYIRSDFAEDQGEYLMATVLEECAHYITQAKDCTRDFQEFAFKVAVKSMMLK